MEAAQSHPDDGLTAHLALIPLVRRGGNREKKFSPAAIVTLGGLLTSTILNMIVVPVLFDRLGNREALHNTSNESALKESW